MTAAENRQAIELRLAELRAEREYVEAVLAEINAEACELRLARSHYMAGAERQRLGLIRCEGPSQGQ